MTQNRRAKTAGLIVLDGWGYREEKKGNAVALAKTPTFQKIWNQYPHTLISTSGPDVGLPVGQMGNSEVGHMNLGAGRVVMQDLMRINRSVHSGEFYSNPVLQKNFKMVAESQTSTLHLLGLVSDGGVHSHLNHLIATVKLAQKCKIKRCLIHVFTDGRDTLPKNALGYLDKVEAALKELQFGEIATVCGRFYAMDRDKRWDRLEKAYRAICEGQGEHCESAAEVVKNAYAKNETDEFITPSVIYKNSRPIGVMDDGDGIFLFNFRPDRCRELVSALTEEKFSGFKRNKVMRFSSFCTMTSYHEDYAFPVAFAPLDLSMSLGEILEREKRPQLRIAETEKFPHVTFFFSCGRDQPFSGEERILIPSPRDVKTYDLKPQMSAPEVTEALCQALQKKEFQFFILNLANPDMVGHTGVLEAAIKAVETVDHCLDQVLRELSRIGGSAIVTADHGNCEQMIQPDGTPHTSHTTNPVPLILVDEDRRSSTLRTDGILADIAPSLISMMGLENSPSFLDARQLMTGKSLIR